MKIECINSVFCHLGESPVWCPSTQSLYFVDIKKPAIYRMLPNLTIESFIMPSEVGSIVLTDSDMLIAALRDGISYVSVESFKVFDSNLIKIDEPNKNRFNDAKCDALGRYWVATMDDGCVKPTGSLYMIERDLTVKKMDSGFIVGNGIDWNIESNIMYFTDSENRTIFSYEYNLKDGSLCNKRIFAKISTECGYPDGLTVDSEDGVWSAHWDGGCITRYFPNGKIDKIIKLPVPRPTSLTFGGENFDKLYVTTASIGISSETMKKFPLSGSIFVIDDIGVKGRPCNVFIQE